jgi:hypothetical protein
MRKFVKYIYSSTYTYNLFHQRHYVSIGAAVAKKNATKKCKHYHIGTMPLVFVLRGCPIMLYQHCINVFIYASLSKMEQLVYKHSAA